MELLIDLAQMQPTPTDPNCTCSSTPRGGTTLSGPFSSRRACTGLTVASRNSLAFDDPLGLPQRRTPEP